MIQQQFESLDKDILTRAIAEVVCGWMYECGRYVPYCKNTGIANDMIIANTDSFHPLTNRDDACLVVEKLDREIARSWAYSLVNEIHLDNINHDYKPSLDFLIANASASQRMHALCLTVPEILVRYKELGGKV